MPVLEAIDVSTRHTPRNLPSITTIDDAPDREVMRLAELARFAKEEALSRRQMRSRSLRNWFVFAGFLAAPFVAAALAPEMVVTAAPVAVKAYEAVGYDINIYGLEVRRVERQHVIMDNTRVLSVKGDISNISNSTRKIPWLHFALLGPKDEVLYTWTLDTGARPLGPGETTGFVTRVAAPPEAATNLKIRFARKDEIGSKPGNDQPSH
jgi:hypothetical protein